MSRPREAPISLKTVTGVRERLDRLAVGSSVYLQIAAAAAVGVGYYLGSELGFALTPPGTPISIYWPPNAILLGALLLMPYRMWPLALAAVVPAHFSMQLARGVPFATSLGWFAGNTGEALLGAFLVRRFSRSPLEGIRGTLEFLLVGAFIAPLVTSFVDTGAVLATGVGHRFWTLWQSRFLSNALAQVTIVPAIVGTARAAAARTRPSLARVTEAAALLSILAALTVTVFGSSTTIPLAEHVLIYLPFPLLLWAALRFGIGGLGTSMTLVCALSLTFVLRAAGPAFNEAVAPNVTSLQLLLIVVSVPLVVLCGLLASTRRTEESLRETSAKLITAQEQERRRIAQELHDDLELHNLQPHVGTELKNRLERLESQVSELASRTRDLSHGLHPFRVELIGLGPAVGRLCQEFSEDGVNVQFTEINLPLRVDPDVALSIYRIAQEALQNISKHSQASNTVVHLEASADNIVLRVLDDGVGFRDDQTGNLGMASMRDRMRAVGGTLDVVSSPNRGTYLEATAPMRSRTP